MYTLICVGRDFGTPVGTSFVIMCLLHLSFNRPLSDLTSVFLGLITNIVVGWLDTNILVAKKDLIRIK